VLYSNAKVGAREQLFIHRQVWKEKPALSYYYTETFFKRIKASCKNGTILEVGSGPGFLKDFWNNILATDVVCMPWLDAVCDCEKMPFRDSVFDNLILIDVFHHLGSPAGFFEETNRVLKPGGKIIMIEPWITPLSYIFWRYVHHEQCERVPDSWLGLHRLEKRPFDGNAYVPYQCFCRKNRASFSARWPNLKLEAIDLLGVFVYPLTGGFQSGLGIKDKGIIKKLIKLENIIEKILSPIFATRAMIKLEKLK